MLRSRSCPAIGFPPRTVTVVVPRIVRVVYISYAVSYICS